MNAKKYNYRGGYYTINELAEIAGLPAKMVRRRINTGWGVDRAVNERPMEQKGRPRKINNDCALWGHDCFNCPLRECNDSRPVRNGEVKDVPERIGKKIDYNDQTYHINLDRVRL